MALEAGVPVIPVGITGTFEAMPYHRKIPRPYPVIVRFGAPLRFERYREMPGDRFLYRAVTDEIVYEIMMLSGQEYSDEDGARVKKERERAEDGVANVPAAVAPEADTAAPQAAIEELPSDRS